VRLRLGAAGALLGGALCLAIASCNAIWGLDDRPLLTDAAVADSSKPASDASLDSGEPCTFDSTGFGELRATSCWATFDLDRLGSKVTGFEGAAFDGRFLYLAPAKGGTVFRYDTSLSFGAGTAWASFDVGAAIHDSLAFAGVVFDGRYLVFVPAGSARFVRYDTKADFGDKTAWSDFDPTVGAGLSHSSGYAGGTFDGHALYFVPNESTYAQMFDTTRIFTDPTAWSAHHIVDSDAGPGFFGGAFDGRYVYMAPGTLAPDGFGILLRYDTHGDFTLNSSFATFDMTSVNPNAAGFTDAAFDGRYVYFAPSGRSGKAIVTRFDSTRTLNDGEAWTSFDMSPLSPALGEFFGVAFDGRYLYFPPWGKASTGANGLLVRYDRLVPFGEGSSWSTFDTSQVHAGAFQGSAFDGNFVYFAPQSGSIVARFDARSKAAKPSSPGFPASFF
jgi:hypothetical protein